jgi:hypothetical protein
MEVAGAFRFVSLRARSGRFVKKVPSAAPLFMHARETQTSLQPARVRELCARAKLSARQDKTRHHQLSDVPASRRGSSEVCVAVPNDTQTLTVPPYLYQIALYSTYSFTPLVCAVDVEDVHIMKYIQ